MRLDGTYKVQFYTKSIDDNFVLCYVGTCFLLPFPLIQLRKMVCEKRVNFLGRSGLPLWEKCFKKKSPTHSPPPYSQVLDPIH